MNKYYFLIGNIMIHSNNKDIIYKENATLVKMGDKYIDADDAKSILECLVLIETDTGVMTENHTEKQSLFIDKKSLRTYDDTILRKTK